MWRHVWLKMHLLYLPCFDWPYYSKRSDQVSFTHTLPLSHTHTHTHSHTHTHTQSWSPTFVYALWYFKNAVLNRDVPKAAACVHCSHEEHRYALLPATPQVSQIIFLCVCVCVCVFVFVLWCVSVCVFVCLTGCVWVWLESFLGIIFDGCLLKILCVPRKKCPLLRTLKCTSAS